MAENQPRITRSHKEKAATEQPNLPTTPIVPPKEFTASERAANLESDVRQAGEQIKEKVHVVSEQVQTQLKSTYRTVVDELYFIKSKFLQTPLRDHAVQLAATWIVVTLMHVIMNTLSSRIPLSTNLFSMYLEHWQPMSFVIGNAILSRAIDHLKPNNQYAWSCVAMCWLSAMIGWTSFPFTGIFEKAVLSLPLNARNFVWLSALPPAVNWAVKKIKTL